MTRREYLSTVVCSHPDCSERAHYSYDTRADQRDATRFRQRHPYLCSRHTQPDEVLAPDNLSREQTLVVVEVPHRNAVTGEITPLGLFWQQDGADKPSSGYQFGPGFKAWAEDFPVGTRLVVTTRIELP